MSSSRLEAEALEAAAKHAESQRNFDLAAKFYRQAAAKYEQSGYGTTGARCRSIAETIDD